jgi:pentatricopeptide repeat-containing protein PET309
LELADYVNKRLSNSDSPDVSSSELVSFAAIIVRYAMLHGTFDEARFKELLGILRAWHLDDPQFYEVAVGFLLESRQTKLAVKLYRISREKLDMRFSRRILHEVLKVFCAHHSILGMQQVLDDFFRFHMAPTPGAYRRCMKEFASMGDAETVHALFEQYLDRIKGTNTMMASDMSPILSVHAKRGELAEVIKHFDEIKEKYGLTPDILCWNILMHAYCEVNDVDGAYNCWESILDPSSGLTPDDYTFGTIMGICVWNGDLERTIEVYRLADSMKIQKSNAMVDCLVLGHIQDDRYHEAEKICEEALNMGLKGSPTRMWNYLLISHAMRRDLVNVNRVLQRMSEANIDYDGMTYGALMQVLAMVRQPNRAYQILKEVMGEAGIKITNFHYAVVMGGYIATGEFHKVFELHGRMRQREMRLSASNNLLIMKAAFREDELLLGNETRGEQRRRAMEIFGEIVSSMDPQDASGPLKGDGRMPTDIVYPSMLYSYVLFLLAQHGEHAMVADLYEQYLNMLPENKRGDPPISILSTLIMSKYREGDFKSVQECFDLAISAVKTHGSPVRQIPPAIYEVSGVSKRATPERKILPLHQLDLQRIITTYMNSLARQERVDDLTKIVNELLDQGFLLSNKNWNHYITILSKAFRIKLAFTLCERKLMPGWTGWARVRWQLPERNRLPYEVRALKKEPTYLRPVYHTLLYLAKNFLELQDMSAESKGYQMLLSDLDRDCPKTMQAIKTMQRIDGELERRVLRAH